MKYLKILISPFKVKGDLDDEVQLQQDVYDKLSAMIESETLAFQVEDEEEDDGDDY